MSKKKEPTIHDMIRMAIVTLNDVNLQNQIIASFKMPDSFLTPELVARRNMEYADTLPGATGRFGFDESNPILVNECMGEESYLSKLTYNGQRVAFFRISSVANCIDKFVVVPMDCSKIDILYLDMYHTFQSKIAPEGYEIEKIVAGCTGTSECSQSFEHHIATVSESSQSHFGFPIPDPCLKGFNTAAANELLKDLC